MICITLLLVEPALGHSMLQDLGGGKYYVGALPIEKQAGSAQGFDLSRIFGQFADEFEFGYFDVAGNFPCIVYRPFSWMVPEAYLREKGTKVKSMAVFSDAVVYLTSSGLLAARIDDHSESLLGERKMIYSIQQQTQFDYIKAVAFDSGEKYVLANGFKGFLYARIDTQKLELEEDFRILNLTTEFRQDMKVQVFGDYVLVPGRRSGLNVLRLTKSPVPALSHIMTLLNTTSSLTDIVDVAVLPSSTAAVLRVLILDYNSAVNFYQVQLDTQQFTTYRLQIERPLSIGCYAAAPGETRTSCLVLAEDQEGNTRVFDVQENPDGSSFSVSQSMRLNLYGNAKYIKVTKSTALVVGESDYIVVKKGWQRKVQAWTRFSDIEMEPHVQSFTRVFAAYNNWVQVDKVRTDPGSIYCSPKIAPGVYEFNISAISPKCPSGLETEELRTVENGANCTYVARVTLYVAEKSYQDIVKGYAWLRYLLFVLVVAFVVAAIISIVVIVRTRKRLNRYEQLEGERVGEPEPEVTVELGSTGSSKSVAIQANLGQKR